MHPTRRTTAVSLALMVVMWGCAQPSGDPEVSAPDVEVEAERPAPTDPAEKRTDGASDDLSLDGHHGHGAGRDDGEGAPVSVSDGPPTDEEIAAAFAPHASAHTSHTPVGTGREFPTGIEPARVHIPAIGVDAEVTELSLAGPDPEVPEDFAQVGWYVQTREPGEIGPAVLAGHVDSRDGPAVFVDLGELRPGDLIRVTDDDGAEREFVVDALGQYPKDDLPEEVLGFGEPTPQLRLITCGGTFDRSSGHYRDNVVVYASLTGG